MAMLGRNYLDPLTPDPWHAHFSEIAPTQSCGASDHEISAWAWRVPNTNMRVWLGNFLFAIIAVGAVVVYADPTTAKVSFIAIKHEPNMLSSELEVLSVERFDVTIEADNKKAKLSSKVLRSLPWKGSDFDTELHYNGKMGLYVTHFEQHADKDGKKRGSRVVFFSPENKQFDRDFGLFTPEKDRLTVLTMAVDSATGDVAGICAGLVQKKMKYYVYKFSRPASNLEFEVKPLKIENVDKLTFAWRAASSVILTREDATMKNLPKKKFLILSLAGGEYAGFADSNWQVHIPLTDETGKALSDLEARMYKLDFESESSEFPTSRFPHKLEAVGTSILSVGESSVHSLPSAKKGFFGYSAKAEIRYSCSGLRAEYWMPGSPDTRRVVVSDTNSQATAISVVGRSYTRGSMLGILSLSKDSRCYKLPWLETVSTSAWYSSFSRTPGSQETIQPIELTFPRYKEYNEA